MVIIVLVTVNNDHCIKHSYYTTKRMLYIMMSGLSLPADFMDDEFLCIISVFYPIKSMYRLERGQGVSTLYNAIINIDHI